MHYETHFAIGRTAFVREMNLCNVLFMPESSRIHIRCDCGAVGPHEIQEAFAAGWRRLVEDDSYASNFAGLCPNCR